MKNLLKMSLLGLVIACAISGCVFGKKGAPKTVDTGKTDSFKTDASAVKPDTLKGDSVKK